MSPKLTFKNGQFKIMQIADAQELPFGVSPDTLKLMELAVQAEKPDLIVLQSRSPSCGVKMIYDGSFSGRKIPGQGLFAEAAVKAGFKVLDIEDIADGEAQFY